MKREGAHISNPAQFTSAFFPTIALRSDCDDCVAAHDTLRLILSALLPFAIGYFMSYLLRAVNAVVAPDLVKDLGLSPGQLGLLTAAYLGAFALFQLPLGVLLDRYGPRKVQAALLTVAARAASASPSRPASPCCSSPAPWWASASRRG